MIHVLRNIMHILCYVLMALPVPNVRASSVLPPRASAAWQNMDVVLVFKVAPLKIASVYKHV